MGKKADQRAELTEAIALLTKNIQLLRADIGKLTDAINAAHFGIETAAKAKEAKSPAKKTT